MAQRHDLIRRIPPARPTEPEPESSAVRKPSRRQPPAATPTPPTTGATPPPAPVEPSTPPPAKPRIPADRVARVREQDPAELLTAERYTWLKADEAARLRLASERTEPVTAVPLPREPAEITPRLALREDGKGLLYPGETHWLFGAPGLGKTWLAYWFGARVAASGKRAWLLDYEMSANDAALRLTQIGLDEDAWPRFLRSDYPVFAAPEDFARTLAEVDPALVIIDSCERLFAAHGYDATSVGDMSKIDRLLLMPAKRHGAAVVMIDHVTKSAGRENADALRPVNSGAKEAIATVLYRLGDSDTTPIRPGAEAKIQLWIPTKDRHGRIDTLEVSGLPQAGWFVLDDTQPGAPNVYVAKPGLSAPDLDSRVIALAEFVRANPGATWYAIREGKWRGPASKAERRRLLDKAVAAGRVHAVTEGPRSTAHYYTGAVPPAPPTAIEAVQAPPARQYLTVTADGSIGQAPLPDDPDALLDLGIDFEGTGTDVFAPDYEPRLCQVTGDGDLAYVIPATDADTIRRLVRHARRLIAHTDYEALVLDHCYGVTLEEVWPKYVDTMILSHIKDPTGDHALKDIGRRHLGFTTDSDKVLRAEFKRLHLRVGEGYAKIPLDNPVFVMYAGLDPIMAWRAWKLWDGTLPASIVDTDHQLEYETARITRRGLRCDVEATRQAAADIDEGAAALGARLLARGLPPEVATKNSRETWQPYLEGHGATLKITPKTRQISTKADDLRLAVIEADPEAREAVEELIKVKQGGKIRSAYLANYLTAAQLDGRIHPHINPLGARTARMSISQPALQQIPTHPWTVELAELARALSVDPRQLLEADPGYLLVGADYSQIEFRVIATLAHQDDLCEQIRQGLDIHTAVANDLGITRSQAKPVNYTTIYGGGAEKLALTAGIPTAEASRVLRKFRKRYQRIVAYSRALERLDVITTPFGRVLPIDPARPYVATNYMVQSTARDLFVIGLLKIIEAGYGDYLWLPVHDEWILQVPEADAARIAVELGELMSLDFRGTPITAKGEVLGPRWIKEPGTGSSHDAVIRSAA